MEPIEVLVEFFMDGASRALQQQEAQKILVNKDRDLKEIEVWSENGENWCIKLMMRIIKWELHVKF